MRFGLTVCRSTLDWAISSISLKAVSIDVGRSGSPLSSKGTNLKNWPLYSTTMWFISEHSLLESSVWKSHRISSSICPGNLKFYN